MTLAFAMLSAMRTLLAIALGFALLFAVSAQAERRVALVIGNDTYAHLPNLNNAGKDARDMAATLRSLGFEVISRYNASEREMGRAIREFSARLSAGGTGLAFYAGHGIQADGTNYLIPADANIEVEDDLATEAMDANNILQAMKDAGNPLNILILDACRDNPLPKRTRSAARGLAITAAPSGAKGTAILYAAGPGQTAQDGREGGNGVFTGALLKNIGRPGLTLEQVFKATSREVLRRTNNRQRPWQLVSLQGDFVFRNRTEAAPPPRQSVPSGSQIDKSMDLAFWNSVKDSDDPEMLSAYLSKFPNGTFAVLARLRLEKHRSGTTKQLKRDLPQDTAELGLWNSVKNSDDPDELEAFLLRYPDGALAILARKKMATLKARRQRDARPKVPNRQQTTLRLTPKRPAGRSLPNVSGNWTGMSVECGMDVHGYSRQLDLDFNVRGALASGTTRTMVIGGYTDGSHPTHGRVDEAGQLKMTVDGIELKIETTYDPRKDKFVGKIIGDNGNLECPIDFVRD